MSKIKICGLSRIEDIKIANALQLDYIGFVFAKSKRQVSFEEAKKLKSHLQKEIQAVGVFVDATEQEMVSLVEEDVIDVIQLHGKETETDIIQLKKRLPNTPIIKAIQVTTIEDIFIWECSKADYLLLDHGVGGTGKAFDWRILNDLQTFQKPYFLAGGLDTNNLAEALTHESYGVDVSSGVELDGKKNEEKMKKFVQIMKTVESGNHERRKI